MYKMYGLSYKITDSIDILVEAANRNSELRDIIHKACEAVDMPIGDNIANLAGTINRLRRERDELRKSLIRAEAKIIILKSAINKEETYDGW